MKTEDIQNYFRVMEQLKRKAAPKIQRILKVLEEEYASIHVDSATESSIRLSINGIRIFIRVELTTKLTPQEILTNIVAYEAANKNGNEQLEPIGNAMKVEDTFPPSDNPYQFLAEAFTAVLANPDRPFTP